MVVSYEREGIMNRLLLGIVALASVSTPAFAADLPVLAPAPVVAPSTYSFDLTGGNSNIGSFIGGGRVGCDYQTGQFVAGIEGDADWLCLSRTGTLVQISGNPGLFTEGTSSLTSNWEASLRARLGYAANRVLWYATGGVAWTKVSGHERFSFITVLEDVGNVDIVPVSMTALELTAGAGVEYAIADQVTIGLEGRFTWHGSQTFNTLATDIDPVTGSLNLNTAETIGKVNWGYGREEPGEQRERR
jgi:outer membrane immunogenic protein